MNLISQIFNGLGQGSIYALVALGYSQTEAAGAIAPLEQSLPVEELVRQGLKALCSR